MTIRAVYILNGPNLNLLGAREPEIYGRDTLADIETACAQKAETLGFDLVFRQTNSEGTLIDWVQEASGSALGLIINPGAYTHTSIAIYDALSACAVPVLELHLSNIHARESFRHTSRTAPAAAAIMMGLGAAGYPLALDALKSILDKQAPDPSTPKRRT